jgi:hypothetical protein
MPGTFCDGAEKERSARRGSNPRLGTNFMKTSDQLKRENAVVAVLSVLHLLKVIKYDEECSDIGDKVVSVSLNMIHRFIRRQVK